MSDILKEVGEIEPFAQWCTDREGGKSYRYYLVPGKTATFECINIADFEREFKRLPESRQRELRDEYLAETGQVGDDIESRRKAAGYRYEEGRFHAKDIKTISTDDIMDCWMYGFEVADFGSNGTEAEIKRRLNELTRLQARDAMFDPLVKALEADLLMLEHQGSGWTLDKAIEQNELITDARKLQEETT